MKFVKYTSIGLIIGFGGYACYRLIVKQRLNENVRLVPKTKPPPSSSEPVAEKDLQTDTINSSSTLLLKQDKKIDKSSSNESKETLQSLDSEQQPTEEDVKTQPSKFTKSERSPKPKESSKPQESPKPKENSKLKQSSKLKEKSKFKESAKPKESPKPEESLKPEESPKPEESLNETSKPNEESKPDESNTNQANEKIESKTIDETNEEMQPQVLSSDADASYAQDATINSTSDLDASISIDNKKNSLKETSMLSNDSPSTTNCSLDVCPSTPCSSPLDVSELEGETTTGSIDHYLTQRSFSMTSQSSVIGEGMVAKLEQLLTQAGNLAESVGEMNADVATLRKIEPKLLSIAGDSISLGEETNVDSMIIKDESSQTPSLEWDSNGINLVSEPDSNYSTIKEEDESLLNESLLGDISLSDKSGLLSPISSASLNSSIDPSFLRSSIGEITAQTDSIVYNEKEISSLNFSTSDANENASNLNDSKSIAQSNGSLSVDK